MDSVLLTYSHNGGTVSRSFGVESINYLDVDFVRNLKKSDVSGIYVEEVVGYRQKISLKLSPLGGNRQSLYFLYAFLMYPESRQLLYTGDETKSFGDLAVMDSNLPVSFEGGVHFSDFVTLSLVSKSVIIYNDDETTYTLTPKYDGTASGDGQYNVNLIDEVGAEIIGTAINYASGSCEDLRFAYRHLLTLNFGVITSQAKRDWLLCFCLQASRKIDTTVYDSNNGRVYDVVCLADGMTWKFLNGTKPLTSISLQFAEITPRTTIEEYATSDTKFILDSSALDDPTKVLG